MDSGRTRDITCHNIRVLLLLQLMDVGPQKRSPPIPLTPMDKERQILPKAI